ncbi:MAG: M48 family metallopeptidase [Pseudomonadales bacterium]|nr:M48 family metallopeptidase [Pseudomonadales bacterium]
MKLENPRVPEEMNLSRVHPLKEFFSLILVVTLALGAAVWGLSFAAGWAARFIPLETERLLAPGLDTLIGDSRAGDPETQAYLQSLTHRLLRHTDLNPADVSVTCIESPDANAFATLGGQIVVLSGLVDIMPDENALAMVLAHEIGHVQSRHVIVATGRGLTIALAGMVLLGATGSDAISSLTSLVSTSAILSFSREQEREADQFALQILQAEYGHTGGATDFFDSLTSSHDDSRLQQFFNTHPAPADRVREIRALSEARGWPMDGERTSLELHH